MALSRRRLRIIKKAAKKQGIKPKTLYAVKVTESGPDYNPGATSYAGAEGDFQFMPPTARAYGINPRNFKQSANAAAKYLGSSKRAGKSFGRMLSDYNAGPAGAYQPDYVASVKSHLDEWPGVKGGKPGRTSSRTATKTIRKAGTLKRTKGEDNSADRKALLLQYFREDRHKPGALVSLSSGLDAARDTPDKLKYVKGEKVRVKLPEKPKRSGGKVQGGGGYQNTEMMVKNALRGLAVSNFKRTPQHNAAVGGAEDSDHLTTKKNAYAGDSTYGTGRKIANRFGIKDWKPGTYQRYTITGAGGQRYSVQILEDVEGHDDHTHTGVQAI
jgi:hypothetical protein